MAERGRGRMRWFFLCCCIVLLAAAVTALTAVLLFLFDVTTSETAILILCVACSIATVAGVLSMVLGRMFLAPIRGLSRASRQIAAGDFDLDLTYEGRIAELRDTYESFHLMARELSNIETLRSDFIANVSHEFKTPLTSIEGYAMLLQDRELPPEEQSECIQRILDSTGRLSSLVSSILLLSKLEHQTDLPEPAPFSLDEQLRQVMVALEPQWGPKELRLEPELEPVRYPRCDALLYHVWSNLIGNAVKFSPPGGVLRVGLFRRGGSAVVTVSDQGPGMTAEVQRHIFDKFYQGDPSRRQEGSGLGLALVKRILELCGGSVTVESAPGRGSTFTVTLPL